MDTQTKQELLTGFLGSAGTHLGKVTLAENQLTHLDDLFTLMHLNKSLKELHIMNQSYFRTESETVHDQGFYGAPKVTKENKTLEKLSLSLGVMKTIKPLIKCFSSFTRLKDFSLSTMELNSKLHFMTIDNYLISNPFLTKLTLSNVKMGFDQFMILAGTIRNSRKLRSLNLSHNELRNQGCIEVANVLLTNATLQSLNLEKNEIKEAGLVALLKVLKDNHTLTKLKLDNNNFVLSRQLLGFLGDVFVYHNRSLRHLTMTAERKSSILKREQEEGNEFDRDMVVNFMNEMQQKSNLRVFTM